MECATTARHQIGALQLPPKKGEQNKGRIRGEDELMCEWEKRRRKRGDIIKESKGGRKKLQQSLKEDLQQQNKDAQKLEAEAESAQWKKCSISFWMTDKVRIHGGSEMEGYKDKRYKQSR